MQAHVDETKNFYRKSFEGNVAQLSAGVSELVFLNATFLHKDLWHIYVYIFLKKKGNKPFEYELTNTELGEGFTT